MTTGNILQRNLLPAGRSCRMFVVLATLAITCYTGDVVPKGPADSRQYADEVVNVLPFLDLCSERFPHFAEKNRAAVQAWKNENAETIRHVEQDPALAAEVKRIRERVGAVASAEELGYLQVICEKLALRYLGSSPEAGFETPQLAWTQMVNALRLRDIDTAIQSFSPDVRQRYKTLFGSMKDDRLNVFITAFTQIESIALLSADLAIGKCRLPDNHGIEVVFTRINERWYITSVA